MGYIYIYKNNIDNKKYIGQTICNINKRIREHKCMANNNTPYLLYRAINKHGMNNFNIIYFKTPNILLNIAEKLLIKILKTKTPYGYNMTNGGEGLRGYKHSAETKLLLSKNNCKSQYWKGKSRSEETRKKISISLTGKKQSKETKLKRIESRKWYKHNINTRNRISKGHRKYEYTIFNLNGMTYHTDNLKVFCKYMNIVYQSILEKIREKRLYKKEWCGCRRLKTA